MPPRIAYISILAPDDVLEAVAVAAVRIRPDDRPFQYAVGHSDREGARPVAVEPETPERVTVEQAEAFARTLHAAAGSPALDVTLFMVEGHDHPSFSLAAGG